MGIVTYLRSVIVQLKCWNLFASVNLKPAAVTGLVWPAVLGEHTACCWVKRLLLACVCTDVTPEPQALELAMYSAKEQQNALKMCKIWK